MTDYKKELENYKNLFKETQINLHRYEGIIFYIQEKIKAEEPKEKKVAAKKE